MKCRAQMSYLPVLYEPDEILAWMKNTVFADEQVLVAEIDGNVVGYASFSDNALSNLYVTPSSQKCGVGSRLLEGVFDELPYEVELRVFEANVDAIRFYGRYGFETVSRTNGDNEEGLLDRLMRRKT